MNILIVSQYYFPEHFLINEIAPEFVKQGHTVTVLTGLPNYPSGKVEKEYKWFKNRKQTIDGVNVVRCLEIGRRNSTFFLALNYVSFAISASLKALLLKKKYDIVFCYEVSPITMAIPAILYKKKNKVKLYLYCLDIFPESVKSHIKSEYNIFYWLIAKISKYVYNQCDHIGVTSKPFIDYLSKVNGVSTSKMSYIPQHADEKYLEQDLTSPKNNCFDFIFAGNIGYGQNIECIVSAVEIIRDIEEFTVHIVGDGSRLEYIKNMVTEKKLNDKFVFHGRYPSNEMDKFYKLADACLLTLRSDNFVSNTIPGKLQMYMTTGKPIIGAINGAAQEVIGEAKCGICVNANDIEGLANAMKDFIYNSAKYAECGNNAQEYFKKNFTKKAFMSSLGNILSNLMEEN